MRKVYIGTSGYSYPYWKNRFYPDGLAASKWLAYYSTRFDTVELNNTFYRFPTIKNLKKAAESTPENFRFSVKAHKVITHSKRMKDVKEKVNEFTEIVQEGLGEKMACVLFQLPPSFHYSEERLEDIFLSIEHKRHNVVEFRHKSWWNKTVYDLFSKYKLTFCSISFPGLPEDNIVTSGLFYKRMHGVPELFKSSYSAKEVDHFAGLIPGNTDSFVYFNNTMYEAGYSNALLLKQLTEKNKEALFS